MCKAMDHLNTTLRSENNGTKSLEGQLDHPDFA